MPTLTLEETIRGLAEKGEISDIGISRNGSNTKWRAHFTPCSTFGVSYAEDDDPVKALMMAMSTIRVKPRKIPTDRDLAAAEATSIGNIEQPVVEVDEGVEALM